MVKTTELGRVGPDPSPSTVNFRLVGEIEACQPTRLVDEPQSNQPQWLIEKVGIHLREQPVESFIQSCRAMHAPEPCGHFEKRVWEVILG